LDGDGDADERMAEAVAHESDDTTMLSVRGQTRRREISFDDDARR
jgi:hypothetical protein